MKTFQAIPLPDALRFALRGYRWFQCRRCFGIFILGRTIDFSVLLEAKAAHEHEQECRK